MVQIIGYRYLYLIYIKRERVRKATTARVYAFLMLVKKVFWETTKFWRKKDK